MTHESTVPGHSTQEKKPDLGFKEVLKDGRLRKLSAAQFVSIFGDFLAIFAIFSVVSFRMHGTPEQVSGIMIAYVLPVVFVSPLAGVFVDRWNVRTTMIVSDVVRAVLVLFLLHATTIWQIYAVLVVLSAISSFFMPAQAIAIRSIVPKEGLLSANAIMMQIMQLTQIASPALAGLLTQTLGEGSCFWIDSVSFLGSAGLVAAMRVERATSGSGAAAPAKKAGSILADMTSGVRFIFTHSTLAFTIICMAAGLFAIRSYSALAAIYVRDILHLAQGWFGALGSLVGVGMIIGTQVLGKLSRNRSKGHIMMAGLVGLAFGVLILALVSNAYLAAVGTLVIGFAVAMVVISAQTMMQGHTPIEMLGRVSSSLMSVLSIAQVAGLALAGSAAQAIGIRNAYIFTAVFLVVIAAVGWRVLEGRQAIAAV